MTTVIPSRLIWARKRKLLGQHSVATHLGVDEKLVSSWERGVRKPNRRQVAMLAHLFGTTMIALTGPQVAS